MKKLIILTKEDSRYMNFEEVFESFKGLITKKASGWINQYEYDDLFQIASMALWKAYEKYNAEEQPVGFAHYANIVITKALLKNEQLNFPKTKNKTSKIKELVSIDKPIATTKRCEEVLVKDFVGDMDYKLEYTAERLVIKEAINKLNNEDKFIVSEFIKKNKATKSSEVLGVSTQNYNNKRTRAFLRMRRIMEGVRV